MAWDIAGARAALGALRLHGANLELASRWLQLWHDGRPPSLARFDAHPIPSHVPAVAVFEIREGVALNCIRAGDYTRLAIGFDLTGQSVLAVTNNVNRDARLDWCWKIVEGAATVSYRAFKSMGGGTVRAQGMSLPLSDRRADGTRLFFMHNNWRPQGTDWIEGSVSGDLQTPPERAMRSFAAPARDIAPEMAGAGWF
ncbi:MAG: hypothetical protein JOZ72_04880 [Alphaproteobacteria bacterium]|nr:hypothetical protein [Alphaproteobacteria bacterium]